MLQDLRYTLRSLAHRRGFALVVVLTLGLGIGSATAIYSVVHWFLFRGPSAPKDVCMLGLKNEGGDRMPFLPAPFVKAYAARADVFAQLSLAANHSENVIFEKDPVTITVESVSPSFFDTLGITPGQGRLFGKEEAVAGRDNVIVVTNGFWKQHLGGKPDALGRTLRIGDNMCAVVGILKEDQRLPIYSGGDVFRPLVLNPNADPWDTWMVCFGKLKPDIGLAQAEAALGTVKPDFPAVMRDYGEHEKPYVTTVTDAEKVFQPQLYWTLVGAVGFLYAIACLNATNLILVHLLGRRREISVRMALGGRRAGILRLLLAETLLLSLGGAIVGALVANWLGPLFYFLAGKGDPEHGWLTWSLGAKAYGVLAGLCGATAILTALAPAAYLSRAGIQEGLKSASGAVGESPALARVRGSFVVLQSAFAVILLVGAGLMIQTFRRLESIPLGFDTSQRVKLQMSIPMQDAKEPAPRLALLNRLSDALGRVPGVASVGYGSNSLLTGYDSVTLGVKARDGTDINVVGAYVSPGFADAGGMRLLDGKWLGEDDKVEVLINETYAKRQFPGTNPVGQYIRTGTDPKNKGWLVVGEVADVHESLRKDPKAVVYMPVKWSPNVATTAVVRLRATPDGKMVGLLKQAVYALDPKIIIWSAMPMSELRDSQLYNEKLTLSVLRVLSVIALLLTVVGMFSVLAYTVDKRMGEFGIRMALGATPKQLVALVAGRGLVLAGFGIAAGVGGAVALTRFLQSLLFEAPPFDFTVIAAVGSLLLVAAVAACVLPALKASKPDLVSLLKGSD